MDKVSVVLLNYNTPEITVDSINSLRKYTKGVNYEIILVDNGSREESKHLLKKTVEKLPNVKIIYVKKNLGFGKGLNLGIKHAKGKYLFLMSCDILFYENSLKKLLEEYKRLTKKTKIAFIQPRLYLNKETKLVQQTCAQIPTLFQIIQENFSFLRTINKGQYNKFRCKDWDRNSSRFVQTPCAAAMFCEREFFIKMGLFDKRFHVYFEEYDLAKRCQQLGYKNYYTTKTSLVHLHGVWPTFWLIKQMFFILSVLKYASKNYS